MATWLNARETTMTRRSLLSPDPAVKAADLLLLCVVLAEDVFGLIDADAINVAGALNIDLVWQVLLLVVSVVLYHKSRRVPGTKTSATQGILLGALVAMCFVAAWRCNVLTGQPFVRGILPQRGFIVCILAIILLRRPFRAGLIDMRRLACGIVVLGSVAALLYLAQVSVGSSIAFIHANSSEKYGGLRLYVNGALSTMAGLVGMWIFLRSGRWKYLLPSLLALGVVLFVSRSRLELVTYLTVLIFLFVSSRGPANAKVLVVCIAALALILFTQTEYFGQVSESFANGQIGGAEDTGTIRVDGRIYYDYVLQSTGSNLLGCGYPSTLYLPAAQMAGFEFNYLLVDNGVFGFRYVYGNLGVTNAVLCMILAVAAAFRNRRNGRLGFAVSYVLYLVLPCFYFAWWWNVSDWAVMTALVFSSFWAVSMPMLLPENLEISSDRRAVGYQDGVYRSAYAGLSESKGAAL